MDASRSVSDVSTDYVAVPFTSSVSPVTPPVLFSPSSDDILNPENPLEARFLRDTTIRGFLNELVNNLDPQEVADFQKAVMDKEHGRASDDVYIANFSRELSRIFSALEALHIQVVALPPGRQHFFECTPVEWVGIYEHLLSKRQALEQGTYPIDGAIPLSVRPHPSWSFSSQDIRNSKLHGLFTEITDLIQAGMPEDFSNLARIFSELDGLGVHIVSSPKGGKDFSRCTPVEWRRVFVELSAQYAELSYRIDDLAQKLAHRGGPIRQNHDLSDFVRAEVSGYRPKDFAVRPPDGIFQRQVGRLFGEDSIIFRWVNATGELFHSPEIWLHPTPKDASDYIRALVEHVLPGMRKAVAHHTSWQSAQAYDSMSRNHDISKARALIDRMYNTHDAALAVLRELDALVVTGRDREMTDMGGQRDVAFILGEVQAGLAKFNSLK